MSDILIAFDPGASIGYSVWDMEKYSSASPGKALIDSGYSNAPKKESPGSKVLRIVGAAKALRDRYSEKGISRIITERMPFYPKMDTYLAQKLADCQEVNGMIKAVFVGIEPEEFHPVKWQKATLSGIYVPPTGRKHKKDQTKEKAKEYIRLVLSKGITNSEEADAICFALWYLDNLKFANLTAKSGGKR